MAPRHLKNAIAKLRLTLPPGTSCVLCHNLIACPTGARARRTIAGVVRGTCRVPGSGWGGRCSWHWDASPCAAVRTRPDAGKNFCPKVLAVSKSLLYSGLQYFYPFYSGGLMPGNCS